MLEKADADNIVEVWSGLYYGFVENKFSPAQAFELLKKALDMYQATAQMESQAEIAKSNASLRNSNSNQPPSNQKEVS